MTSPLIFIGTHKVKPGKREAFKEHFAKFSAEIVEPQEPRLHSFWGYAAPDSDYVTIVQVHPDAESMAWHMEVGKDHFAVAYAEYLEQESVMQVYGNLTEDLGRALAAWQTTQDDSSVTIREPFAGFDRLPESVPDSADA